MATLRIGLDVWPGNIRGVVVDDEGTIVRRFQRSGADEGGVAAAIEELSHDGEPASIGVAVGEAEENLPPNRLRQGSGESAEALRAKAEGGSHIVYVSPGPSAIVAESWVGAAQGAKHAVCLWIGDRVLAGILLDGTPWEGAHGLAGAAAHLALNPVERQDYRKFGSLAAEVSNKGIARRLSWRIQAGDHSAVLERAGDLDAITATHVFEGARSGDGVAISVVRDTAKYIGMAVSNFASILDPEVVVLGGAVAGAGDLLLDPVRQECARRLAPRMLERFRLEISPLLDYGVAVGAARLAAGGR